MKPKAVFRKACGIAQAEGPESGAEFILDELKATRTKKGPGGQSITEPDHRRRLNAFAAVMGKPPRRKR